MIVNHRTSTPRCCPSSKVAILAHKCWKPFQDRATNRVIGPSQTSSMEESFYAALSTHGGHCRMTYHPQANMPAYLLQMPCLAVSWQERRKFYCTCKRECPANPYAGREGPAASLLYLLLSVQWIKQVQENFEFFLFFFLCRVAMHSS